MPITITELLADPHLGLSLLTATVPTGRDVLWAHSSELSDPTPWLEGGELLMTLGLGLPTQRKELERYVARLARRGVVGLAIDTGIVLAEVPEDLIAAGERHALPVLRIPAPTPFIAISRAVLSALTADAIEAVSTVATHQERVAAGALRSGARGVVQALAGILPADVALLSGDGTVLARAGADVDRVCARVLERVGGGSTPGRGRRTQSFVHVYADGVLTVQAFVGEGADPALLAIGSAVPFDAHQRLVIRHAVAQLALLARTPSRIARVEEHLRAAVARSLFIDEGPCEPDLARALGFDPETDIVVACISGGTAAQNAEVAERILSEVTGPSLRTALEGGEVIAVPASVARGDRLVAVTLAAARGGVTVGLSGTGLLSQAGQGMRQAHSACRIARLQSRPVVAYADLAPLDALLWSQPSEATSALVETVLGRVVAHDARCGTTFLEALEAFLANNGQAEAAANALRIHRHTLKQWLDRAEGLLGRDLSNAAVRADVWLALRARSVLQSAEAPRTVPKTWV